MDDKGMHQVTISVDRDSIIEYHITENLLVPKDLLQDFAKFKVIDEKYWYTTPRGSESYMMLSQSRSTYKRSAESLMIIGKYANDMSVEILKLFDESAKKHRDKNYEIDFISLGTGTAEKELKLLDEFFVVYKDKKIEGESKPITFIPIDLSYALLLGTVEKVYTNFKDLISYDELKIQPYMMNFRSAKFDEIGNSRYKFITALNVIPNMAIPNIFKTLESMMDEDTLLLIDVDMVEDDEKMIVSYEDIAVKRFISSPMDLILSTAKYAHEIKRFGNDVYQNVKAYDNLELDLDHVHAKITTHDELDQFIKTHNLPKTSKKQILVSPSAGSKTIILLYDPPEKNNSCVLGYSTRFTPEGFDAILKKTNLESVTSEPWVYGERKIMYYLLRLKRDNLTKDKTENKSDSTRQQTVRI